MVGASREPHINVKFVRFVCLSFCPYVHDTKIYKSNSNLRAPLVVDMQRLRRAWCTALYTNVQQTCSDKQLEQTGSYTRKQVNRSLMNNNFI